MRRIFYFIATNAAIMIVAGIIIQFLPAEYQTSDGRFLIIALVAGFGGSIVSLLMSKSMAKRAAGVYVIESPRNETEQWLLTTVARQAEQAGIGMPEVGIFETPDMNAFATGANKNNALVAVSTGLLHNMTRDEAEAVMGHEIAHVANGDMVTLALIQGVVNTFVLLLARALALAIDRDGRGIGYFVGFMAGQVVFGFLASIVVAFFSRRREYRADAGGAEYAGAHKMIAALEKLKQGQAGHLPDQLAAFGINSSVKSLFSTHPPLEERIAALKNR
ncbi:heat shock protein HtpX [Arenicella xantha]|uniref:Protease HtpX n=1 Tax=Arenicella xantha TaxID=644221 RepID=A0A395JIH6_9GAMM|nr:protease HtpX [Arenicella xantha]RBP48430.1 heat shock protein HtpX [Arenicella xantha]